LSEKKLFVELDNGGIIFNTKTGELESYNVNGNEFVNNAPYGNFTGIGATVYRAPIDNDMYLKLLWNRKKLDTEKLYFKKCKFRVEDNKLVICNDYRLSTVASKNLASVSIFYNIFADGKMSVMLFCNRSKLIMYAPRFGAVFEMPKRYDNVKYLGNGPMQNLPDFKEHAMLGTYECKVDDMREKYIKPQESSMRTNVRFADVTDKNGVGLRFTPFATDSFIFSADHFTSQQCAKANHQEDLKLCDTTVIHIDGYQLGAGSNACGPMPTKDFRLNRLNGVNVMFDIEPIGD
jgi:hypothetical protein